MTAQTWDATLERALTVGGIGRAPTGELSPVSKGIYAGQYARACEWKKLRWPSLSAGTSPRTFTPELVAQYALELTEQGYARSTVGLAVRSIRWGHRVAGEPVPDSFPASYVLRGGDPTANDHDGVNDLETPARRDPSDLLTAFVAAAHPDRPGGIRDRAIVNLLFHTGITVNTLSDLDVDDITLVPPAAARVTQCGGDPRDPVGMLVSHPGTTTRVAHCDHPPGTDSSLCPVCTTRQWLTVLAGERSTTPGLPLLRAVDKAGNIAGTMTGHGGRHGVNGRLNAKAINALVLRALATRAGLLDCLRSPARALRLAGACAAYVSGEVDAAGAATRAGYKPGSLVLMNHLLELTAPNRKEPS